MNKIRAMITDDESLARRGISQLFSQYVSQEPIIANRSLFFQGGRLDSDSAMTIRGTGHTVRIFSIVVKPLPT